MPTIKLYGPRGGSAVRCHWLMAEAGVSYEPVSVDMQSDERHKEPFLSLNPNGQIPVLVIDDFVLAESLAINNYIAGKYKPELLGGTDEEKAIVWQWSLWALFNPQTFFYHIAIETKWRKTNNQAVIDNANQELKRFLGILDKRLSTMTYIAGEKFTVADINAGAIFRYIDTLEFDMKPYPNITRWLELIMARPAYLQAQKD